MRIASSACRGACVAMGLLALFACSGSGADSSDASDSEAGRVPPGDEGSGGVSPSGGRPGGAPAGAQIGGESGSGRAGAPGPTSNGGTSGEGTGGSSAGALSTSGGAAGAGASGRTNSGVPSGGSSTAGSLGTGGGTVRWMASDYVSRKWARWPIPNSPSLKLPHPMSYTATPEGVLDDVTGLVWRKAVNSSTTTWADALAYCQGLGEGWSLPTRIELTSILENAKSGAKVAAAFDNAGGWTWTSTPWVVNQRKNLTGSAALSWFINFSLGDSNNSLSQTAASAYSRCVKIPATQTLPAEHYTVAQGEVTDHYTGLVWQRGHSGPEPTLTHDQAVAYCRDLNLNGQTFRLPSLNELASIVDDVPTGDVSPAIDHAIFPETSPDNPYWSQSPYGTSSTESWILDFEDGFTSRKLRTTLAIVRCVR